MRAQQQEEKRSVTASAWWWCQDPTCPGCLPADGGPSRGGTRPGRGAARPPGEQKGDEMRRARRGPDSMHTEADQTGCLLARLACSLLVCSLASLLACCFSLPSRTPRSFSCPPCVCACPSSALADGTHRNKSSELTH